MKKVLIVGAKGMLGQELVRVFSADKKYEVFGWDKNNIRLSDSLIFGEIDITDEAQVKEKIGALAPRIIINAAAYNDVDMAESAEGFEAAKKLNGLAPGYLARAARKVKLTPSQFSRSKNGGINPPDPPLHKGGECGAIFVHYSSDYVFDGQKESGYKENDAPSPIGNYGWSKLLGEKQVQQAGGNYYIIRLQKLFGWPAQSPGAKKSFFYTMLSLAKEKKELEVVDEELANFTYAPDLADYTKFLVESNFLTPFAPLYTKGAEKSPLTTLLQSGEMYPYGIYHIINEGAPMTWCGAARVLFELAGVKDIKLIPVSSAKFLRPAKRPKYSVLLNTKLPSLRPWPEALKEFLLPRLGSDF